MSLSALASTHELDVVSQPDLERGDMRLLAERSQVDARLPEVLRHLRDDLVTTLSIDEVTEPTPSRDSAQSGEEEA